VAEAVAPALERAEVVVARLGELFEIDRAAGTNRPGLGPGEQRAHDMVAGWMREAGLEIEVDRGGNLFGRLRGSAPDLPEVWSGSHLDTPPDGGAFDGALGVLTALEAAAAVGASDGARRTIAVVAFRLEEGPRFGRGVFGSRAVVGQLEPDEGDLRDPDGVTLAEAFAALGFGELPAAGWADPPPACFVEAHIEQGPALAALGAPLGIVTSIAGMAGIELVFSGRRGHAGTVPMHLRADAVAAAAAFVTALHEAARGVPGGVATVGSVEVSPGASNTIPGRAALFADVRAPEAAGLERLVAAVDRCAAAAAAGTGCTVEVVPRWRYEPEPMDRAVRDTLRRAVAGLGLDPVDIASGAGHDAAILAAAGIPTGMLFVRSDAGGVSHAPEEHTGTDAVAACLAALEPALRELAA
jgi:hydantoinase/carbamoylase family amidase